MLASPRWAGILVSGIIGGGLASLCGPSLLRVADGAPARAATRTAKIAIDYPAEGSIFPPEITPPLFRWRDPSEIARHWAVDLSFANPSHRIHLPVKGEFFQPEAIDPAAGPEIQLTPEQMLTHVWRPSADTWEQIKRDSVKSPVTITILGYEAGSDNTPVARGAVTISTSSDPVGAPVFYRDVPLITTPSGGHGSIQPLPASALPIIKWSLRDIGQPESRTLMTGLHTCANCHSFSQDGKTMGLDLDGPRNDKGLYALTPVTRDMIIRSEDVIRWSSFELDPSVRSFDPSVKRFGFMSQVSPNGRFVVTSIGPPDAGDTHGSVVPGFARGILDRLYSTNYPNFRFSQVFYPTRGILAWYDRTTQQMRTLPGADDPAYVQTSAFWSPDGKYLIFSRATARDPYPPGAPKPEYANDPREPPMQYDLYKIPFNDGRGGKAEPVAGASANGMSNNFPKVSPDGKWIVFVQNRNGLLMRPDSQLYMVPFSGGEARRMNCNTPLMNSWHSFSPNGRWLAFSSKAPSPYTHLMLTHIDADGNDSPAIVVENATAANRAVNIPEFVNVPPGGIAKINPQATALYQLLDQSLDLMEENKIPEAIEALRKALALDPGDASSHSHMGALLTKNGQPDKALEEFQIAVNLDPRNPAYRSLLGMALARGGQIPAGVAEINEAIDLQPLSPEYRVQLAEVLELSKDYPPAIRALQKAVELSRGKNGDYLSELAECYFRAGRPADAIQEAHRALDMAVQNDDQPLENKLLDELKKFGEN